MSIKRMVDLDLTGKRVLIRQDLNVPVKNGQVNSDIRIQASVPTIEQALAKALLLYYSHTLAVQLRANMTTNLL